MSREKKTTSELVCRRSCSANALSIRTAATTIPSGVVHSRAHDWNADRLIQLVARFAGLEPQPFGRLALQRPADECAASEILVEEIAVGGPGLEDAVLVGDEHPVGAGLIAQLVGLVEKIGPVAGAERFSDARDVGRHLYQRPGEPDQRAAPALDCIADRGLGRPDGPGAGSVRRRVGALLGDQQRQAERRDDDECGAEKDPGAERHGQYRRPCCG